MNFKYKYSIVKKKKKNYVQIILKISSGSGSWPRLERKYIPEMQMWVACRSVVPFTLLKLLLSESRKEPVGMGRQPGTQEKEEEEEKDGESCVHLRLHHQPCYY